MLFCLEKRQYKNISKLDFLNSRHKSSHLVAEIWTRLNSIEADYIFREKSESFSCLTFLLWISEKTEFKSIFGEYLSSLKYFIDYGDCPRRRNQGFDDLLHLFLAFQWRQAEAQVSSLCSHFLSQMHEGTALIKQW